jgi:hypothetical protein
MCHICFNLYTLAITSILKFVEVHIIHNNKLLPYNELTLKNTLEYSVQIHFKHTTIKIQQIKISFNMWPEFKRITKI